MKRITLIFAIFVLCLACLCSCSLFGCKHSEVVDQAVAPTCTSEGLTEGKHCSKCGEVTVAQQKVAPIEHTKVILEAKDPTCTEDGLTAGVRCSVCDTIVIAQETVPATHTYGEWTNVSEPDCFLDGEDQRVCLACDHVDSRKISKIEHSFAHNPDTGLFACEKCDSVIYAGSIYAAFDVEVTWYDAYKVCDAMGGHLVTITSKYEQDFLNNLLANKDYSFVKDSEYLYHTGGMLNSDGWQWVTGEEFDYTYWGPQGLDNTGNNWIVALTTPLIGSANAQMKVGDWETNPIWFTEGYICEWEVEITETEHYFTEWETVTEVTCFNDGEEYRFCTHCGIEETRTVTKFEHNFILDETTGIDACEHCGAAMYNGKMYLLVIESISWFGANAYCENLGGHLVTITSAEEQSFIESYMSFSSFTDVAWIGAFSDGVKWRWVTDEVYDYTNWSSGNPDCYQNKEFFAYLNYQTFGKWNDGTLEGKIAFICEWEIN